jgi:hypothetical protein
LKTAFHSIENATRVDSKNGTGTHSPPSIRLYDPIINFVQGRSRKTTQVGVDKPWLHVTKELFPLNIAYGNFTFEKGTLAITSELAASNGKIHRLHQAAV